VQVHLFDGTYELFRAFFGAPPVQHAGREVGATRVLMNALARMLKNGTVTHGGVAYDHVIESFRNDLFPGYKTGEGIAEGLLSQFELAERAAAALGLVVWPMIEFEADDAIATAAHRCAQDPRVDKTLMATVDKDMCQCVIDARVVCWDRWKDVTLDHDAVIAKHGVEPESIPDLLALVGDTADGIPGIDGWGKSSAAKLLAHYKHIVDIPANHATWKVSVRGADKLAATLNANRETAELYRVLATLRIDCPIPCTPDELEWRGVDREMLGGICEELGVSAEAIKL
jgi:5'-3' exonuclease